MDERKEIIKFINLFSSFGRDIIDCFTCGNCYWFAQILEKRFGGTIVYYPIMNHFAFCKNECVYDITGQIEDKKYYDWEWYKEFEPIESARIIKQCITKEC